MTLETLYTHLHAAAKISSLISDLADNLIWYWQAQSSVTPKIASKSCEKPENWIQ